MLIRQKNLSLPRNFAIGAFRELLIVFSMKVDLLYLLYSTARRFGVLHLIKQHFLLKTFLRTLILIAQDSKFISFPSRTNLKLHNISVTFKIVKKLVINLDSSKASGPD